MDGQDEDEDDGDYHDPTHRHFFVCIQVDLERANSAHSFHATLERAIRYAHTLDAEELAWVADIASRPWNRRVGRPKCTDEKFRVFLRYVFNRRGKITRAEAVRAIVDDYKRDGLIITRDKAGDMYDSVRNGWDFRKS